MNAMKRNKCTTLVSSVNYPKHVSTLAAADHIEIKAMHSHRSPSTYGCYLRDMRLSPQPRASFGTALADLLVEALSTRSSHSTEPLTS